MEKYIPYEKLSKKERRKLDAARRTTWGSVSPVTRKPVSSKAYNRRKAQSWKKDVPNSVPFHFPQFHLLAIHAIMDPSSFGRCGHDYQRQQADGYSVPLF